MVSKFHINKVRSDRRSNFTYWFPDPATGKLDANTMRFDERNITKKYIDIHDLAQRIFDNGSSYGICRDLLRMFHRTIEHGEIPEWEGASVNQVT